MHYLKIINARLYVNSCLQTQKTRNTQKTLENTHKALRWQVLYSQVPYAVSSEKMYFILLFYSFNPFPPKNNSLNIFIIILKSKIDFSTTHLKQLL